jgi:uncharacterized repeat protein (TIGR03803 family)
MIRTTDIRFCIAIIGSILTASCAHAGDTPAAPFASTAVQAAQIRQADTATFDSLYSFGISKDASETPAGGLLAAYGHLYGTTVGGGPVDAGTVFEMTYTGSVRLIYAFKGGPNGDNLSDGAVPGHGVVALNGKLYGTTQWYGHIEGLGTAFEVDPGTGKERVLHHFGAANDGTGPGTMVVFNRQLYGTTASGGAYDYGTVFELNPSTGAEHVVYSFGSTSDDGRTPGGLIVVGGLLYGITGFGGGITSSGTIFQLNPKTGKEQVIHRFQGGNGGSDGFGPSGALVELNHQLYGTTAEGGTAHLGTLYSLDPKTRKVQILYSFGGGGGAYPNGLTAWNGMLYGTTNAGGITIPQGSAETTGGVAFESSPSGNVSVLYEFPGGDNGMWPLGGVVAANGSLYGTTESGGGYDFGTAYRISLTGSGSK